MSSSKGNIKSSGTTSSGTSELPTSSFATNPGAPGVRKFSLNLDPDIAEKMLKRRTSLEKLKVEKVAPWMQLYDFSDENNTKDKDKKEELKDMAKRLEKRRASLDLLQVEKLSPWMELYDFTDKEAQDMKDKKTTE